MIQRWSTSLFYYVFNARNTPPFNPYHFLQQHIFIPGPKIHSLEQMADSSVSNLSEHHLLWTSSQRPRTAAISNSILFKSDLLTLIDLFLRQFITRKNGVLTIKSYFLLSKLLLQAWIG